MVRLNFKTSWNVVGQFRADVQFAGGGYAIYNGQGEGVC